MIRQECFRGKNILITGGQGFIGSSLAIKLTEFGSKVTLLDAMVDGHGGNIFNAEPVKDKVKVIHEDVRNVGIMNDIVRDKDYIFHLAGQNDHVLSLSDPFPDIDINIKGSAVLLEACKKYNKKAKLVYTGTRGEYGKAAKLPVDENAPMNPKGIYELSSLTVQKMFKIYNDNHGVRSVTLRLTNIYGERAQMKHDRFGVANWFIRLALDNATIKVFGDGSILRDFLYVEDTVNAILMCAQCDEAYGEIFNVGNDEPSSFLELAKTVVAVAGTGRWEFASFSPDRAAQEPGDFYSDINKIKRTTGWKPVTDLKTGLKRTVEYYRKHKSHYW
ncbi:MAG: NAD-dependent epimerase/dehydratase family protein [Candidatus Omnitrophica bacterium]|nr:NAD-dependent epimerase/dehydratase family protein [Candidatus Omnitrophota bacterium]